MDLIKDEAQEEYIDKARETLARNKDELPTNREATSSFYIFFSFDLVNSTLYKSINQAKWPLVITKFYEFVEDSLKKRLSRVRLWKYVGDELLFYLRISRIEDARDCVTKAYNVMQDTIERIHQSFSDTRTILSVKTTVWCAMAHDLPPGDIHVMDSSRGPKYSNLIIHQPQSGNTAVDFLGPDIDIGFRIAKFAAPRRLVVSANLGYFLYRDRARDSGKFDEQLRIVAYEQLKGVWNNRHYPIIWYEEDWERIKSSFLYDEHHQHEIVRQIRSQGPIGKLDEIVKVFNDLGRREELEEMWSVISELNSADAESEQPEVVLSGPGGLIEVHCVAVCFRANGYVLIAQRHADKRRFPGHWEFGCGQLDAFETFEQCLQRSYHEDFNAHLKFSDPIVPIRTYTIGGGAEKRRIPGIIFLADVTNHDQVKAQRHAKVEWIDPLAPIDAAFADCVPNFAMTLRQASEIWKSLQQQ